MSHQEPFYENAFLSKNTVTGKKNKTMAEFH
jgi:hypothetical protein